MAQIITKETAREYIKETRPYYFVNTPDEFDGKYMEMLWRLRALRVLGQNNPTRNDKEEVGSTKMVGASFIVNMANFGEQLPRFMLRQIPIKSMFAELAGFLIGVTNAEEFRILGTGIWKKNANQTEPWVSSMYRKGKDDLGKIYSKQWTNREDIQRIAETQYMDNRLELAKQGYSIIDRIVKDLDQDTIYIKRRINQVQNTVRDLKADPYNRRIKVEAWNPGELEQMALPPCHTGYTLTTVFDPERGNVLNIRVNLRSWDVFLGGNFNILSYCTLLRLYCNWTGLAIGEMQIDPSDAHLYSNQVEAVDELLERHDMIKFIWLKTKQELERGKEDDSNLSQFNRLLQCYGRAVARCEALGHMGLTVDKDLHENGDYFNYIRKVLAPAYFGDPCRADGGQLNVMKLNSELTYDVYHRAEVASTTVGMLFPMEASTLYTMPGLKNIPTMVE